MNPSGGRRSGAISDDMAIQWRQLVGRVMTQQLDLAAYQQQQQSIGLACDGSRMSRPSSLFYRPPYYLRHHWVVLVLYIHIYKYI